MEKDYKEALSGQQGRSRFMVSLIFEAVIVFFHNQEKVPVREHFYSIDQSEPFFASADNRDFSSTL